MSYVHNVIIKKNLIMSNFRTIKNYCSLLLIAFVFASCESYKHIPYFQDLEGRPISQEKINNLSPFLIQPADILGINVSSRNPESSSVFNYNLSRANGNNYNASPDNPVVGYLVDEKGLIHLPIVGELKVSGSTTSQVRDKLDTLLVKYYKDPVVNIRILNFKVSILGDVARPNVYNLQNEQTSITEALSLAGDLNITALRTNVLLIRNENGQRKYVYLDLTSKKIIQSPYFYLKNNDQIYVSPGKTKFSTANDTGFKVTTLVLSALSIIAIVISRYR